MKCNVPCNNSQLEIKCFRLLTKMQTDANPISLYIIIVQKEVLGIETNEVTDYKLSSNKITTLSLRIRVHWWSTAIYHGQL